MLPTQAVCLGWHRAVPSGLKFHRARPHADPFFSATTWHPYDRILERLRQRAAQHARSTEVEAQEILAAALPPPAADPWAVVNALRNELAQAGREFPESTVLVREDRDR